MRVVATVIAVLISSLACAADTAATDPAERLREDITRSATASPETLDRLLEGLADHDAVCRFLPPGTAMRVSISV